MSAVKQVRNFVSASLNRRIFGAAATVASMTLAVKFAAMAKEVLVAASFGTGDQLDAFLIGFMVPGYVVSVIAGSFSAALIPVQVQVREAEGHEAAHRLFAGSARLGLGLLMVATLVLAKYGPSVVPLLCVGFSPEKVQLAVRSFYLCLPTVAIGGLVTIWESGLNARERFGLAALAPVMVPVATVALLVSYRRQYGADTLAWGLVIGGLLHLAVLGVALARQGMSLASKWYGFDPWTRSVVRQYISLVLSAALICSNILIDQVMASRLPPGSVAALSFGGKLVAVVLTVGTMALGTAVLPFFAKAVSSKDWDGLRHTLNTYIKLILFVTIPVTAIGILASRPLVESLFERGRFTSVDTALVGRVQALYFIQIPFYALTILFVRMISSLQANHLLIAGTVLSISLNVTLNFVLMPTLGVAGIALATSLTQIALSGFTGMMLYRKLGSVGHPRPLCAYLL